MKKINEQRVKHIKKHIPQHYSFDPKIKQNVKNVVKFTGRNSLNQTLISIYYYQNDRQS